MILALAVWLIQIQTPKQGDELPCTSAKSIPFRKHAIQFACATQEMVVLQTELKQNSEQLQLISASGFRV
jgi:hypothetical protein